MLVNDIQYAIKDAMKQKDINKRDVLKMALSKAQAIAKEKKCDITDEIMLDGIAKEVKQLKQTRDSLVGYESSELYVSTVGKIETLETYLPKMMTEEEITAFIEQEVIELTFVNVQISPKIKGMLMKNIMPKLKGKADSKVISDCVSKVLSNK